MPYPGLLYPEPLPLQQSTADPYLHRRHSNTVLSQSWCTHGLFEPSEHLWGILGLSLNVILPLLPSCWGFFALGCGVSPKSCSSSYCLAGASLPLEVGYLLTVTPVVHCKEQYCTGTWNVRSRNRGKLEVVKQEMARVSMNVLGIGELKWSGMGEFNSDDHYIHY